MSIQIDQLTKNFGRQKAVNHISFSVKKGEIVGFLGPNGAGKSTTMKMITGYLTPDEGSILIAGLDTRTHPIECKQKIGYLAEANPLYLDMYVKEYLSFIAGVHGGRRQEGIGHGEKGMEALRHEGIRYKVEDIIEKVGLQVEQHKKIGQLSKGYKQRVGLAAAILHNPEVLILDEPTSGLDPNQIIEIRNLIKELGQNKTVLFSSHILQEVAAICSRIIIIHKGEIVADDSLANLTAQGSLEEVFRSLTMAVSV